MAGAGRGLVILDRDGVVNVDSSEYVKSPDEWVPVPGALEAIARLDAAGFDVVIATNQSGVGRGLFTEATLQAIHTKMRTAAAAAGGRIAAVYYCPHRPDEGCDCRKPAPGLLLRAAAEFGGPLTGVAFIGDSATDVAAAVAAGARPVIVGDRPAPAGVPRYADLAEAADAVLAEARSSS